LSKKIQYMLQSLTYCILFFCSLQCISAQTIIGYGWAKNAVNTTIFRKNSVVSGKGFQFVSYYDSVGNVVIAKRKLNTQNWQVKQTQFKGNVKDAHNVISMMIDGKGFLHLSWNHHGNQLNYAKSKQPLSLDFSSEMPMLGKQEQKVTYPEFLKFSNGDLLFLYRDGGSGNGNLVMNKYSTKTQQWQRLQDVLIDGENKRNAYWQACIDAKDNIHIAWVWRESADVASNHDMCYAISKDKGASWQKSNGEIYQLPITEKSAEVVAKIPQNSELINQTSITTDEKGTPFIATYFKNKNSNIPQYQLIYWDQQQWKIQQISERTTPFSLSGTGTKKIPIARPIVIAYQQKKKTCITVLCRDEERGSVASAYTTTNLSTNKWIIEDLNYSSLGNWEPSYDTELFKQKKQLHIFIQRTGQGDGEKLENIAAQPVSILEKKLP